MRKRILVVDDHPLMRASIAECLGRTKDLEVCATAATAPEALGALEGAKPDLILTDLSLPGCNGFKLVEEVCARLAAPRVVVLSMHSESFRAESALRAGAAGYVTKGDGTERILAAVRKVLTGGVHFSEPVAQRFRERIAGTCLSGSRSPIGALSASELGLLRRLARRADSPSGLRLLARQQSVLAAPLAGLRAKLGLHNNAAVVHCALLVA